MIGAIQNGPSIYFGGCKPAICFNLIVFSGGLKIAYKLPMEYHPPKPALPERPVPRQAREPSPAELCVRKRNIPETIAINGSIAFPRPEYIFSLNFILPTEAP